MKKSFKIFSIVVALGLLVGAFGLGPVLAKQIDRGSQDVLDSAYAPSLVTVGTDDVQWSDSSGNDVSFVKPDSVGVFYIKAPSLEQTRTGTRYWGTIATSTAAGGCAEPLTGS